MLVAGCWLLSAAPACNCPFLPQKQHPNKNGVAPNSVSLPSGPGSIAGLGEAFQPLLSAGSARYAIQIDLPRGVAGHAPQLKLQYDSALGDSPASLGWTYGPGAISRQVDKGLPRYLDGPNGLDDDHDTVVDNAEEVDQFVGPDGEELVPIDGGSYRARIEGSFSRYRRIGDGWQVDLKSGTRLVYGETPGARVTDAAGTRIYRWLLESSTDANGNRRG
ncbi:MAG: hypothetical protein C1943_15365 [Halochromatium sp.]|nr:hypothetical protein [Halochromatium sp.]